MALRISHYNPYIVWEKQKSFHCFRYLELSLQIFLKIFLPFPSSSTLFPLQRIGLSGFIDLAGAVASRAAWILTFRNAAAVGMGPIRAMLLLHVADVDTTAIAIATATATAASRLWSWLWIHKAEAATPVAARTKAILHSRRLAKVTNEELGPKTPAGLGLSRLGPAQIQNELSHCANLSLRRRRCCRWLLRAFQPSSHRAIQAGQPFIANALWQLPDALQLRSILGPGIPAIPLSQSPTGDAPHPPSSYWALGFCFMLHG